MVEIAEIRMLLLAPLNGVEAFKANIISLSLGGESDPNAPRMALPQTQSNKR